jgi:hypothetical protein
MLIACELASWYVPHCYGNGCEPSTKKLSWLHQYSHPGLFGPFNVLPRTNQGSAARSFLFFVHRVSLLRCCQRDGIKAGDAKSVSLFAPATSTRCNVCRETKTLRSHNVVHHRKLGKLYGRCSNSRIVWICKSSKFPNARAEKRNKSRVRICNLVSWWSRKQRRSYVPTRYTVTGKSSIMRQPISWYMATSPFIVVDTKCAIHTTWVF